MANGSEYKRKYDRMRGPFTIKILSYNYESLDSEYCSCAEGINISPGGISFKYPKVIGKNDHLRILIQDLRGHKKEEIFAHVKIMWTETKDILTKKFGAKFLKIPTEKKIKLMQLTRKNGGI